MNEKLAYLLAIIIGLTVANSCTFCQSNSTSSAPQAQYKVSSQPYGAYLAGRIAHIRHDLGTAADYYMQAAESIPEKQMIYNQLYVMLTSTGRIDEAVKYAKLAQEKGDTSPFIYTIISSYESKQGNFSEAIKTIEKCDNPFADAIFNPLILAWNYAGAGDYEKAISSLSPLTKNPGLKGVYLFQAGAISDFMGKNVEADKYYSTLLSIPQIEISFFSLQTISNFYIRQGQHGKAVTASTFAKNRNNVMLNDLITDIRNTSGETKPFITSSNIGLSDAMFNIAVILLQEPQTADLSLLFASLARYLNPDYSLPNILIADIMEKKEFYADANKEYQRISPTDYSYYTGQFQTGKNYLKMGKHTEAEKIFVNLYNKYPPNPDILTNIAEVYRLSGRHVEAIKYYKMAIESFPANHKEETWPLYFAVGISYTANNQDDKAEECFREVIKIRPNSLAQNHLGYTLLQRQKNIDEAFELIVKAYNTSPEDGNIADSLGWAFYKIGKYDLAVKYLEKALDITPSEAVVYDHLGDAYWQEGRKNEAIFQWNHAISLNDKTGEVKPDEVREKIKNGVRAEALKNFDEEKIKEIIKKIRP